MPSDIVPGRSCGNCTLCCKVLSIPELQKPRGAVCVHCDWRKGCKTYAQRPMPCRAFDCSYLLSPGLGEEWKPTTSHFVLGYVAEADIVLVFTDPDHAHAWRQEPYYSRIKRWAAPSDIGGYVVVWESARTLVLSGADEFDLGELRDDQTIVREEQPGPAGKKVVFYAADGRT
ncbi:MAG: hypothetical protein K2P94_01610 [Rhodospirillaceae bacterium]|nr:hypothetical protein [Rhodospirillaceae bacterium]